MESCQVVGCAQRVSKAGFEFCYDHWKAQRAGQLGRCDRCGRQHQSGKPLCPECATATTPPPLPAVEDDAPAGMLSSTKVGEYFGLSSVKVNLILAELGWIERYVKGWTPTDRGNALGANVREMRNGTPYVVWPNRILDNAALKASINEQGGKTKQTGTASADNKPKPPAKPEASDDFRSKFPCTMRTQDGHMVRSRAEVLIDNFLYVSGIVHAYERRLPIEEDCYCDFYIPKGKGGVYIEYWGLEADPKYRARKAAKQGIYAKYNFQLIELGDAEIERLDDVLPRMLLRFGIESA